MRFINDLYTASIGEPWSNERLLPVYEQAIARLPLEGDEQKSLRDFVRFQLVGERSRRTVVPEWEHLGDFRSRASAFEKGANLAVAQLADQIVPAANAAG